MARLAVLVLGLFAAGCEAPRAARVELRAATLTAAAGLTVSWER